MTKYVFNAFILIITQMWKDDDLEKHHASEDEKLFNEWNNRQTNVVTESRTQHVVIFASTKRQRSANVQQSNE
jgi:hypothetical protein